MVELLSPLALTALSSLAVPLAIHLLSRHYAQVIKVGSIKFLKAAVPSAFRRFALSEWGLLVLRLLLLALATLALARPILHARLETRSAPGWVLVSPDIWQRTTDPHLYHCIDSLCAIGYEAHLLLPGFPALPPDSVAAEPIELWSMLEELDHLLPQDTRLVVLTGEQVALLRGMRPTLSREVIWLTFAHAEKKTWVQCAKYVGKDSVWIVLGESHRDYSRFQTKLISRFEAEHERYILPPPAPAPHIAIFFDEPNSHDATYLRYALQAIRQQFFFDFQLTVRPSQDSTAFRSSPDILFWLSERALPPSLTSAPLLLRYGGSRPSSLQSVIALPHGEQLKLSQKASDTLRGNALWTDGFGAPILEQRRTAHGTEYIFYSRFSPDWNQLVLSPIFPEWIAQLVLHELRQPYEHDLRRTTNLQRLPHHARLPQPSLSAPAATTAPHTPLALPLWIFVTILFIIERALAHQRLNT
jgi:hypothetical protein